MAGPQTTITLDNFEAELATEMDRYVNDPEFVAAEAKKRTMGNPIALGPAVLSADDWAEKQITRASAAADEWVKGVQAPRRNPVSAAIAANDKRKEKLAEAEKQEKWLKAMNAVNVDEMIATAVAVGADGFRRGVEARRAKITRVVQDLQPRVAALRATIEKMPQKTDAEREARMLAAKRGMQALGKSRRGISA